MTVSIASNYKIPVDASANVHSVSAVGERYIDLVSTGAPGKYFSSGQTITKGAVPSEIESALDNSIAGWPRAHGEDRLCCSTRPRKRWVGTRTRVATV